MCLSALQHTQKHVLLLQIVVEASVIKHISLVSCLFLICYYKQFFITPQLKIGVTLAVSTVVTAVLVSLISVLVSSSVVYLLMKRTTSTSSNSRRVFQWNKRPNEATVVYDLPNILTVDDVGEKAIQHNAAYGVL